MQEVYSRAMQIWEVPEEFYEAATFMYRDYEVRLASWMEKEVVLEENICKQLSAWGITNEQQLLFESYQRNVVEKFIENNEVSYRMTDFYSRYPYFAQYEPEAYAKFDQELVERLNEWDLKVYMGRTKQAALDIASGKDVPMHQTQYLTLQESYDMMDTFGEEILILPCNCKAMGRCKEKPVDVCIHKLEKGPNTPYDRGLGKKLSLDETKKRIKNINK